MEYNYFENRPHDVALEHRRRVNLQIHERFQIRDNNNPLNLSIPEFVKLYRMTQDDAIHLCNIIRPFVRQRHNPLHLPLIRKLLITLSLYAMGSYQRLIGRSIDCSVSQTTVSRAVREITLALNHEEILNEFIRFPMTHEERVRVMMRNEEMLGMPRVLGCVDGFLTRLSYLPRDRERQSFYGRKGWLALNSQIICDADMNILNIDSRWPGSVRDNLIWNVSTARQVMEAAYRTERCWLLGDSGYYTAPWLHTPLPHAARGTPEYDYTKLHCHCRNVVERCIGCLKGRWRLLGVDHCINYRDAGFDGRIIVACCVLHNYCNRRGVPLPVPLYDVADDDYVLPPELNDIPFNLYQRGLEERQFLIDFAHQRRLNLVHAM